MPTEEQQQKVTVALIALYMPTEEQQQKVTVALIALFRDAPASFRKLEEYPWLLAENAKFWMQTAQPSQYRQTAQPSQYRQVWKPLRDCLVEMDLFQAMYHDQHVSDLHDYWHVMADVYDLVTEYKTALEAFSTQ
ncbi:hypothetical protein T484DRAFT_1818605, partial [Baffinella frigidus]